MLQIILGIALWYAVYKWFKKHYTITAKEKRYTPEEFYAFLAQEQAIRGNTAKRTPALSPNSDIETVRTGDEREIDIVSNEEWEEFLKWHKWRQNQSKQ